MDPKLLEYYTQELTFMREMGAEFARQHPKIARRLGMHGIEVADPYVERLIEAFSFLSARVQIKLDAEFPRFTQRLLEVIYPNYVAPTPSMAVAQIHPSMREGNLAQGFTLPRGTPLRARIPTEEKTACEFRSSQDVTLWPIELIEARLTGAPPDVPSLDRYLPSHIQVRGALRLRLRMTGENGRFNQLAHLDQLPLYLCGDDVIASHLLELICTAGVATLSGPGDELARGMHVVTSAAVAPHGLDADQGLLPLQWNTFQGHNLLHEYFACPSRFYFFALTQLADGLGRLDTREVEIAVLLDRAPPTWLMEKVDARQFALFCTPVVNLFQKRTDRVEVNPSLSEFHLVPDRSRPLDYEVFAVRELHGQQAETTEEVTFRPMYQTLNDDEGNYGRYFSMRREPRLLSDTTRKYGTRTPYTGSEVFLALVDQNHAPYPETIRFLSVTAWVTNRDLPSLVPRNGHDDLSIPDSAPVERVGLIRAPSKPRPAFASDEMAWRLIRQLGLNYIPFSDLDHRQGGQAFRDLLKLFVSADDAAQHRQIQALIGSKTEPVTRRLPGNGPLVYGRGVTCDLTVDEDGFSGTSPYVFGLVLEHYIARHVSINVFSETRLHSMQRGLIARWPARMGGRGAV